MASAEASFICRGRPGACELRAALLWLRLLLLQPPLTEAVAVLPWGAPPAPLQAPDAAAGLKNINEVCGKNTAAGRIFGGHKAPISRWPWQASLLYQGQHICGATLIDHYWVATAAHCFQRSQAPKDYRVLLGYNQLNNPAKYSRQMTVNRVILHPDYQKFYPMGSDLVMLQLHLPVEFSPQIVPACLPGSDLKLPPHHACWISGWGMLTEDHFLQAPYDLQEAEVGLIDNMFCKSFFEPPTPTGNEYTVQDDMLCAGDLMTGKSICRGDSGGPLVCKLNNSWFLVGVSSWSYDCRPPVSPSVFTRVTYFAKWIKDIQSKTPTSSPDEAPSQGPPPAVTFPKSMATTPTPWATWCLMPLLLPAFLRTF
ncbi:inactive serine protease 39-like [Tamandua tetradactyla]|uniref:inactive serine protease 39-like n=1 Tax=Tamandua tetradactyla TaxID=48850 RepID=UPI004053C1A4